MNPKLVNPGKGPLRQFTKIIKEPIITNNDILSSSKTPIYYSMTKNDILQRNSFIINLCGIIFIVLFIYFLYNLYLERKYLKEYLLLQRSN